MYLCIGLVQYYIITALVSTFIYLFSCDSDVSAFYPESSSTRRLSIDLFNDDYSSDNLFITKNKTEVVPSLQDIPEVTVSSNLDVTPSGNPEDLFSEGTLNSSVFESTKVESEVEKKGDGVISGDGECVSEVKVKVETKPPVAKRIMSGGDKDQEGLSTIKKGKFIKYCVHHLNQQFLIIFLSRTH